MPASPYQGFPLFDPPAPSCEVTISCGVRARTRPALIDSGASCTCIPVELVADLKLRKIRDTNVGGATGQTQTRGLYTATLELLGLHFPHHPVVSLEKKYIIIGRDILNKYNCVHSGPTLTFSLQLP